MAHMPKRAMLIRDSFIAEVAAVCVRVCFYVHSFFGFCVHTPFFIFNSKLNFHSFHIPVHLFFSHLLFFNIYFLCVCFLFVSCRSFVRSFYMILSSTTFHDSSRAVSETFIVLESRTRVLDQNCVIIIFHFSCFYFKKLSTHSSSFRKHFPSTFPCQFVNETFIHQPIHCAVRWYIDILWVIRFGLFSILGILSLE